MRGLTSVLYCAPAPAYTYFVLFWDCSLIQLFLLARALYLAFLWVCPSIWGLSVGNRMTHLFYNYPYGNSRTIVLIKPVSSQCQVWFVLLKKKKNRTIKLPPFSIQLTIRKRRSKESFKLENIKRRSANLKQILDIWWEWRLREESVGNML